MEISHSIQRRKHFRLKVFSLKGELSIDRIRNTPIQSRARPILLVDICPYGLRFESDLHFPATRHIILKIRTKLANSLWVELDGQIVWRRPVDNMFEYGMKLEISDSQAVLLRRLLNDLLQQMSPHCKEIHRIYKYFSVAHKFNSLGERKTWNG